MYITLNSKRYWTTPGSQFSWSNVQDLSTAFRTTGVQQRSDNIKVNRAVRGWDDGVGFPRLRRDRNYVINGMRDATVLTMHNNQITLGIQNETQTHASPADHVVQYVHYQGALYGAFEEEYASGSTTVMTPTLRKWNPDVWDSAATIITENEATDNNKGGRVFDMITHKAALLVLCNNIDNSGAISATAGARSYVVRTSVNASSFADVGGTGWPTSRYITDATHQTNDFDTPGGRLLDFGNTLMAAIYEDPDSTDGSVSQVRVLYSTDTGANWTAGAVIPSGSGPMAFVRWKDPFTSPPADAPVLVLTDGVYRVDSGGTTFDKIFDLDGEPNNGRWAKVGQDGGLILGAGTDDAKILVLYMDNTGSIEVRISNSIQTFVSLRQGRVNSIICPPLPWYVVAYGGAADKSASVFAVSYEWRTDPITGKLYQPWHSMWMDSGVSLDVTQLFYSSQDERISRLHFTLEQDTGASILYHLERPFVDPASGATHHFNTGSGVAQYVEWAEDDLGDPHSDAAVYRVVADADDLSGSTSGEYITVKYGTNGGNWTANTLGNLLSSVKALDLGTSSRGVSAKTFRLRVEFFRDNGSSNTSHTAKLKEIEVQSRNKLVLLERYGNIAIDLGLTAQQERITPFEVFTRLRADISSVTNLGFTLADRWTEQQVEVVGFEAVLTTPSQGVGIESQEVSGVVNLTVEEVLNV